jgi:adenine-specific DNA-methyltransferase
MEKLKMHTSDQSDANIARIREVFPACVTEVKDDQGAIRYAVDFDQLRQELSGHIVEGPQERYQLNWPGKRESLIAANAPITKTLRPSREDSVNFDATKNLFIEGNNLDALKLLQETYLGKVKLIYIDPPYNTGKDFIYRDNFAISKEEFERASGARNEEGGLLVSNPESHGRFHSDWLSMIYPRLLAAKRLLSDEGVILISIDDAEQASLRKVCDLVFGEGNFIAQLVWEKGRKNDAKFFSVGHEYILIYAKNVTYLRERGEIWREEKPGAREIWAEFLRLKAIHGENYRAMELALSQWYSDLPKGHPAKKWARYKRIDKNGPWRDRDISWPGGDGPKYDVLHPETKQPCAVPEAGWRYASPEEMQRQIKLGLVEFRADHTEPPFRKAHIRPIPEEAQDDVGHGDESSEEEGDDAEMATQVRGSYFYKQSQVAVKYLRGLMGAKVFSNPKDHDELSRLIEYATPKDRAAIIMDFFAGSASTAEAVLRANATYGTNHRFIVVQLPEDLEEAAASVTGSAKKTVQAAIKFLTKAGRPLLLSEVTKARIRLAGEKVIAGECNDAWSKDVGFRSLKIDTSNMADVYYTPDGMKQDDLLGQIDNVKPGRDNPEDLLFQVLVDWGVDLTLPIRKETVKGKSVFFVNAEPYDLIACFDRGVSEDLVKELAKYKPVRIVLRDNGFESDAVKINVEQIFRQLSPSTNVKSI